jgi:hypothetical protein
MTTHIGSITGPILLGSGMDLWGPPGLVLVTAGSIGAFTLFGLWRYLTRSDVRVRV